MAFRKIVAWSDADCLADFGVAITSCSGFPEGINGRTMEMKIRNADFG